MLTKVTKTNSGFSLIEIMISIGIMMIIAGSMSTLIINTQKQNTALQQKLTTIEYEQLLTRLLADSSSCNCMFSGIPWPTTITSESKINISSLKMGCSNTVNLLQKDQVLSNAGSLKVESIDLKNLKNLDATPTKVSADIVINFTPSSVAAGTLKPITLSSQNFNLTGANISSCLGMAGSDKMCTNLGGTWNGATCSLSSSPEATCIGIGGTFTAGKCSLNPSKQASCENIGGTWNGTNCKLNITAGVNSSETCASTYGTGWTWNGSACVPPATSIGKLLTLGTMTGPCSPSCSGCSLGVSYNTDGTKCDSSEARYGVDKIPSGYEECVGVGSNSYCVYDSAGTIKQNTCYQKGGKKYYPYRCGGSQGPISPGNYSG